MRADEVDEHPVGAVLRADAQAVPERRAIPAVVEKVDLDGLASLDRPANPPNRPRIGARPLKEPAIAAKGLHSGIAGLLLEARTDEHDRIVRQGRVGDHHRLGDLLGRQYGLGFPPLENVNVAHPASNPASPSVPRPHAHHPVFRI